MNTKKIFKDCVKKSKTFSPLLQNPNFILTLFLTFFVAFYTSGFCNDANAVKEIDTLTNTTISTIFSPWVRRIALVFGGGWGLFQSYMGGSIKPLLLWGGLGLIVNFIPKIVNIIASI